MSADLPFFKFFASDWLSDLNVRMMDCSERGIYIDLLAFDWIEDGIPADPERLARALRVDADRMREAWEVLASRFEPHPDKDGYVTNRRLAKERADIRRAAEKRSEAARHAAKARWSQEEKQDAGAGRKRSASDSHSDRMPSRSREKSDTRSQSTESEGGIAELLGYLPERAHSAMHAVAATTRDPDRWAKAIMGLYGPRGTEERTLAAVAEDERPEVLAVALQRLAAEGEPYRGNFFRGIVRSVVRERSSPDGPDFGDESDRDTRRRHDYRVRESERRKEQWEAEDAKAEEEMAELWSWWEELEPERRQEIEDEVAERAASVPENLRRPILIGVIQEHRQQEAAP